MQRQVQIDALRSQDPTMLEIVLQEALRKPIPQIETQTLVDIIALSEVETLSKSLQRALQTFVGRVTNEVADLPEGAVFNDFTDGLGALAAEQVPAAFRSILDTESAREGRSEHGRSRLRTLLDGWQSTEPEVIALGEATPKIEKAVEATRNEKRMGGKVEEKKPTKRKKSPVRKVGPKPSADPVRDAWIRQQVLERLAGKENGLSEMVLIAGIRHSAKPTYPHLLPFDIKTVLKRMGEESVARHSAGRWSVGRRW